MATTAIAAQSYPAFGEGGLSVAQWAKMYGSPEAIVEDQTGIGFALSRIDASNTVRIGAAGNQARINGYTLELVAPVDFTWPAPSVTTTLLVAAVYDPALNVALSGGSADPSGPVQLVFTTDTLDPGKAYLPLFSLTRTASQTLSQATAIDMRVWHGPRVEILGMPDTGRPVMPRGSTAYDHRNKCDWSRVLNAAGTGLEWVNLDSPPPTAFAAVSGLVSRDGPPSTPQLYSFARTMRGIRGNLKRSSGANLNNGNDVVLGSIPVGSRPKFTERFNCVLQGNKTTEVRVEPDGDVIMLDTGFATTWIDLSACKWRAES